MLGGTADGLEESDVVALPEGTAMGTEVSGSFLVAESRESCSCQYGLDCLYPVVDAVRGLYVSQADGRLEIRPLTTSIRRNDWNDGQSADEWWSLTRNLRLVGGIDEDGSFRVGNSAVMRDTDYLPIGDELHLIEGEVVAGERIELMWRASVEWALGDRDCYIERELILGPTGCEEGLCPPPGAPGDPCDDERDCRTESCESGACGLQSDGASCWIDSDCFSGVCIDAVCS